MARYIASNIDPCTYLHIRVLVFVYAQLYICLKKLQSSVYDSKFVCYNVNIINLYCDKVKNENQIERIFQT